MKQKKKFEELEIVISMFHAEYDVLTTSVETGDAANEQGMDLGNDENFWAGGVY